MNLSKVCLNGCVPADCHAVDGALLVVRHCKTVFPLSVQIVGAVGPPSAYRKLHSSLLDKGGSGYHP